MTPTGEWYEFVGWLVAVGVLLMLVFSPMVLWDPVRRWRYRRRRAREREVERCRAQCEWLWHYGETRAEYEECWNGCLGR